MSPQYGERQPTSGWDLFVSLGTPGNFNGFHVLAALLHGTLVEGVSQTAALNRGRHLYSAGRPSRWTLAHISSFVCCCEYKFLLYATFWSLGVYILLSVQHHLPGVDRVQALASCLALCCHSNETRAPVANLPNSAQWEGTLYHSPKLPPGLCTSVRMWWATDRHTQTLVTNIHFAFATPHAKCNKQVSSCLWFSASADDAAYLSMTLVTFYHIWDGFMKRCCNKCMFCIFISCCLGTAMHSWLCDTWRHAWTVRNTGVWTTKWTFVWLRWHICTCHSADVSNSTDESLNLLLSFIVLLSQNYVFSLW